MEGEWRTRDAIILAPTCRDSCTNCWRSLVSLTDDVGTHSAHGSGRAKA